jgi:hypothetical protein
MGYGREETVYPAGLVCGGWRSATATARSLRTSTRFSWHDFLQRQQVPPEWLVMRDSNPSIFLFVSLAIYGVGVS